MKNIVKEMFSEEKCVERLPLEGNNDLLVAVSNGNVTALNQLNGSDLSELLAFLHRHNINILLDIDASGTYCLTNGKTINKGKKVADNIALYSKREIRDTVSDYSKKIGKKVIALFLTKHDPLKIPDERYAFGLQWCSIN